MENRNRRAALAAGFTTTAVLLSGRAGAQAPGAGSAEQRLRERGITLPPAAAPVANYAPTVRTGNLVFVSGQGPRKPDGTLGTGKVGKDITTEEAYRHARYAGLALLALLRAAQGGSLDGVRRAVKVFGMVNAAPDFGDHPKVIDGCTDLFVEVFGDAGRPARSAVGMGSLPFGITVEIEAVFEVA